MGEKCTALVVKFKIDTYGMIDHAVNAQNVGLNLRPTQLILFSDPKIDAMVIGRSQTSGIDIPQKILVWEDEAGEVRIFYNSPGYLIERHTIKLQDSLVTQLADVLNQFGPLDNGLITVDSSQTVDDTVTSLKNALENQGFLIPFVIDHSENANLMNVELRPTRLIIFGNPNIGTQLMEKEQSIGIDLPQKFLVWEDEAQQVHITYNDPQFLSNRHNVKDLDQLIENIANALKNLAQTGAGTKR